MGDKTFFTFPAPLKDRLNVVFTPAPKEQERKFIKKQLQNKNQSIKNKKSKSLVRGFTLEKNPKEIPGVKWVTGEPEKVLEELEEMGYKSVILGGGAYVNGMFLKKNLIDEIYVTVEPKIFGEGLGLFKGDFDADLELISVEKINANAVMLKYKVIKK